MNCNKNYKLQSLLLCRVPERPQLCDAKLIPAHSMAPDSTSKSMQWFAHQEASHHCASAGWLHVRPRGSIDPAMTLQQQTDSSSKSRAKRLTQYVNSHMSMQTLLLFFISLNSQRTLSMPCHNCGCTEQEQGRLNALPPVNRSVWRIATLSCGAQSQHRARRSMCPAVALPACRADTLCTHPGT